MLSVAVMRNPLLRNVQIVENCDLVVATPKTASEILRSGTWATIRYAGGMNKPIIIILPDGSTKGWP